MPKRRRIEATEDWQQLELLFTSPEQRTYELIRPVVLYGMPPKERAQQTSTAERTVYRHVQRFAATGMRGVFAADPAPPTVRIPAHIREAVVRLKAEHAGLHLCEIATICYVRFGRKLSHKTVKRVLAEMSPPAEVQRRYPPFHEISNPATRRIAILRLHAEGWNPKSIADYLQTSRVTVHTTLNRWVEEGFRSLPNKSSAPKHPRRKVDFRALTAVRRLGHNAGLGCSGYFRCPSTNQFR
ncbi:MAG TPA: helix-turn-helix domain-containing protein [Herpetosiphonaceae bacterium]|nr:helix-turn-helix domain-containing protein [Herpetosiphonaceae bacterium]